MDSSSYRPKSSVSEDLSLVESASGAEEFVSVSVTDIANTTQPAAESSVSSTDEGNSLLKPPSRNSPESSESDWETLDPSVLEDSGPREAAERKEVGSELTDAFDSKPGTPITVQPQAASGQGGVVQGLVSGLEEDQYGLPLPIFTKVTQSAQTHRTRVSERHLTCLCSPHLISNSHSRNQRFRFKGIVHQKMLMESFFVCKRLLELQSIRSSSVT